MKCLSCREKFISYLLSALIIFSVLFSTPIPIFATTNVSTSSIITNVSNPHSGLIFFDLNIPAGQTVTYKVELTPHPRMGSLDTPISGTIKNSGNTRITKRMSFCPRYYSDKYTITASYIKGPARDRTKYTDVKKVTSALKSTAYSKKFVWDDASIKKLTREKQIALTLGFLGTGAVDVLVTKGYLSSSFATTLAIAGFANDLLSAGDVADIRTITSTPIKGWGYKVRLTPGIGGYKKDLLIYDNLGRLNQTINYGFVPITSITLAIH